MQGIDPMQLLEHVNSFYQSAWDKLIFIVSVLIGLLGIALPIMITYFQNRMLSVRETDIKNRLHEELSVGISEKFETICQQTAKQAEGIIEQALNASKSALGISLVSKLKHIQKIMIIQLLNIAI